MLSAWNSPAMVATPPVPASAESLAAATWCSKKLMIASTGIQVVIQISVVRKPKITLMP